MTNILRKPNGKYQARYSDLSGRQRAKEFERKHDAQVWLANIQADLSRGLYVDPSAGKTLFKVFAAEWLANQIHQKPTTREQAETNLKNHILPTFGDRPLASIRPSHVQAWVRDRSNVIAPATVELVYRYLSTIFRAAVTDQVIAVSPCQKIGLPQRERREVHPLSTRQIDQLVDGVGERYKALVIAAAGTGMRQGELFGLTVDRVDFLRGRSIRVDRQLIALKGEQPKFGPPKTKASVRTIPLPAVVGDALALHLQRFGSSPQGLIFTGENDEPLRRNRFSERVWRPAVKATGMENAHFHDLRHFYASLLIRHGESVKVVQARLGHANAQETLDTYSHLWPDSDDTTRAAVDDVLGPIWSTDGQQNIAK